MKLKVNGYEYYQISLYLFPEVVSKLGDYFLFYTKEVFNELLNSDIPEINRLDLYVYKKKHKVRKVIYVSKELDEKWNRISREQRSVIQLLINKRLEEISKTIINNKI
jgi:hypothetical protein